MHLVEQSLEDMIVEGTTTEGAKVPAAEDAEVVELDQEEGVELAEGVEIMMMMMIIVHMEEDRSSVVREAQGIKVGAINLEDQAAVAAATGA